MVTFNFSLLKDLKAGKQCNSEAIAAIQSLEAMLTEIIDCLEGGDSFVYDPATFAMHGDDGGSPPHGIAYQPKK